VSAISAPAPGLTWGILLALLTAATVFDLRTRLVPVWLTGGGIAAGVLLAAWAGPPALLGSLAGAAVGGLVFLPFVRWGWLGAADALLLAAVGAWQGWRVALWAAWWTALAGALLALGVWAWRAHRSRLRASGPLPTAETAGGIEATGAAPARPVGAVSAGAAGVRQASGLAEPFPYVPAILAGTALALAFGA
jgi:Flp pilus assembly protein protease CpaA